MANYNGQKESAAQSPVSPAIDPPAPAVALSTSLVSLTSGGEIIGVAALFVDHFRGKADDDTTRAFRLAAPLVPFLEADETTVEIRQRVDAIGELTDDEKQILVDEVWNPWRQAWRMWYFVAVSALSAAVQGMDESVVNGAQMFYKRQFGIGASSIRDTLLLGLVNGAPYLCCATVACWTTSTANKYMGRRGTCILSCIIAAITCFAQGFVSDWKLMLVFRLLLGFGIGPKSATTPMFTAECSPHRIRGSMVMMWQFFTAAGIFFGCVMGVAFFTIPDPSGIVGLNWRLMLASAGVPAMICAIMQYFTPESPRWLLAKGRHWDAYQAMLQLRRCEVQAARDILHCWIHLQDHGNASAGERQGRFGGLRQLFKVRRNRNALLAAEIVMVMQQLCGINVIAYYSSEIFLQAKMSEMTALGASAGFGAVNFLFAIPAFFTIDKFGRRPLMLMSLPLMAVFLLWTGLSFGLLKETAAQMPMIMAGIYAFAAVYSPGAGPVPFTYAAEAFPLQVRPLGMSFATGTTWGANFLLALTWPLLLAALGALGAFCLYAGFCTAGTVAVLLMVPETKNKTLEELDRVFDVSLARQVLYGHRQLRWLVLHGILRRSIEAPKAPFRGDGDVTAKPSLETSEESAPITPSGGP